MADIPLTEGVKTPLRAEEKDDRHPLTKGVKTFLRAEEDRRQTFL